MSGEFFGAPEVPNSVGTPRATSVSEDLKNLKPAEGSDGPADTQEDDLLSIGQEGSEEENGRVEKPAIQDRVVEDRSAANAPPESVHEQTEDERNAAIQKLINLRRSKNRVAPSQPVSQPETNAAFPELLEKARKHFNNDQIGVMAQLLDLAITDRMRPIAMTLAEKQAATDAEAILQIPNYEKYTQTVERILDARPDMSMYDAFKYAAFDDMVSLAKGEKIGKQKNVISLKRSAQVEPGNIGVVRNLNAKTDSKALEEALGMGQKSDSAARNFFGVGGG